MAKKDVLQQVDDTVRRSAKTFLRTARHGALATLDPASGTPMASRVSVASDSDGCPVFLISQLSGHFGALEQDPRASLLLGEPGRGDPLAHPRITVFGRAERIADSARARIRARFLARHPKAALYADFGDFAFWRLKIEGASFNGGFGKAYEMTRDDLIAPVNAELEALEQEAVAHMNADHPDAIALYASRLPNRAEGAWTLACIDTEGLDLTASDAVARIWFDPPLGSAEELRPRLVAMAKRARTEKS
ncbi:MAG: HugZ family protein [Paracoccaceae bacterium]